MAKTTDGRIALIAVIALAAWLFVGLPFIYLPGASHESAQSLWVPTDSVGLYTLVLAAFTALLVVVSGLQGYFLLRADKTARVAADAAKRSADSAFAAERARFFIVIESHNLSHIISYVALRGLVPGENFYINYRFANYGKTPGIIKELTMESAIASKPVDPPGQMLVMKEFPERMIGANGSTKPDGYSPAMIDNAQVLALRSNQERFWFYGRLYYDDVFGNHQVHRFYFRSVTASNGDCILQPFDYKDYNTST